MAFKVLCFQKLCCPVVPRTGLLKLSHFFLCSEVPSPLLPSPHQPCLSQPRRLGKALRTVPLCLIQLAVSPSWSPIQSLCSSLEYCTIRHSVSVPQGSGPYGPQQKSHTSQELGQVPPHTPSPPARKAWAWTNSKAKSSGKGGRKSSIFSSCRDSGGTEVKYRSPALLLTKATHFVLG